MEVIKSYPENLDKRELFRLMNSNETGKMSDAEGSVISPRAWVIFNDADAKTGEVKKVVVIDTKDGELFGTISNTFITEFEKIVDYFGGDPGDIKIISGESKAGRTYITCDIV